EFCDGPTHHIASREFELLGAASESPHILKVHCLHEVPYTAAVERLLGGYGMVNINKRKWKRLQAYPCPKVAMLVMERCDMSLKDFVLQKISEGQAAFAGRQVLEALAHLHRLRIIHRDVKPGNILVTDAGARVVLADFGLATYLPNGSDILKERFACGTAGFLAPECKGRLAIFSAKSDMF
ncbi:Negative regulator of sexual conjugation and meiosis, partial [Durusdinium trenchii]